LNFQAPTTLEYILNQCLVQVNVFQKVHQIGSSQSCRINKRQETLMISKLKESFSGKIAGKLRLIGSKMPGF
jgi:hypothetical protein